ncbi:Cytochrome c oxidase, subunit VIb [Ascosphaera apis ARSEF 7405]|uniref:Cytochrome c oxidase, subunit VIb n=1 Tax=Ascosphaera apis ARSEF 7405 TaxID=392613 RepID=A0A167XPH5_9EURO|nr:Cytochrome c oxidase, subunit VIb [Ascosphaera apis ARSEF 7405]
MVWPLSSSEAKPKAPDGGVVAPNRSSRQHCWLARDGFFACLDKHQIVDAIREDEKARASCGEELKQFEGACAKAWVKYFKEKRLMEYQRDMTIERIKKEEEAINAMAEKVKR